MHFHDAAEEELAATGEWYESKSSGLGERFLDAIEEAVALLREHPRAGAMWSDPALPRDVEIRRYPVRTFPFLIVYWLHPRPTILAIAHGNQRPGYWLDRATNDQGPTR